MNRWLQLVAAVVGMLLVAGVLCVWPLLRAPPAADLSLLILDPAPSTFLQPGS